MADELEQTTQTLKAAASPAKTKRGMPLRALSLILIAIAAVASIVLLRAAYETYEAYERLEHASQDYIACNAAANEMIDGSHYLTIQVRTYIVTQDPAYLNNYFWEVDVNQRRPKAVETLKSLQAGSSSSLQAALDDSNELMGLEYYAMRLVLDAQGASGVTEPADLADTVLTPEDAALSPEEKIAKATDIVFGSEYMDYVARIEGNVAECKEELIAYIGGIQDESADTLHALLLRQQILTGVLFVVFVALAFAIVKLVLWPLRTFGARIESNDPLPHTGAAELRRFADAYNVMYEETMLSHDALRRKAEHDHLTGLYNRDVFERLLAAHVHDHYALLLIDVDYFKEINDTRGHDVGDAMLQKLAGLLSHVFRATDYPCRIGGDEFVVIMTEVTEDLKHVVEAKVRTVVDGLADVSDGLPPATLSVGIAFNDGTLDGDRIYKNADQALYRVKEAGRNGFAFFE